MSNIKLGRIPIIALEYSEADKAVPKEILIDYDNGNIYVVNRDGSVIFDITSRVRELIETGEIGSNMLVNVEGVGNVQLTEYLSWLQANMIVAIPAGSPQQTMPRMQADLSSIIVKHKTLQLYRFDEASDNTVPVKVDGVIKWVSSTDLANGEIVDPTDTVVNNTGDIVEVTLNESFEAVLPISPYLSTPSYDTEFTVVLPASTDKAYCKLTWNYITSVNNPEITFPSSVMWESGDSETQADAVHVFEFETWDKGITWFGKKTVYGRPATGDFVTKGYLEDTVYDKQDLSEYLAWKVQSM